MYQPFPEEYGHGFVHESQATDPDDPATDPDDPATDEKGVATTDTPGVPPVPPKPKPATYPPLLS